MALLLQAVVDFLGALLLLADALLSVRQRCLEVANADLVSLLLLTQEGDLALG